MKKIFLLIGFMFICSFIFGQKITNLSEATTITDTDLFMIRSGAVGNTLSRITWANILGEGISLDSIAVLKHADTLFVTTNEYRPILAHDGRIIRCNRATQVKVYLPPDSTANFPIGSTLNFKMDNAGIVSFYESNSVIESKKDSMTINFRHGWATAIKRASNKWDLFGDLGD